VQRKAAAVYQQEGWTALVAIELVVLV